MRKRIYILFTFMNKAFISNVPYKNASFEDKTNNSGQTVWFIGLHELCYESEFQTQANPLNIDINDVNISQSQPVPTPRSIFHSRLCSNKPVFNIH